MGQTDAQTDGSQLCLMPLTLVTSIITASRNQLSITAALTATVADGLTVTTGPPNGPVLFCRLAFVVVCRLS